MVLHLIYFSPNGTTKKTVRKISEGFGNFEVIEHDLLLPENRKKKYNFSNNDLVILGMPSAGMLYGKVNEVFDCLNGNNTAMIGVILYGNGYYGKALKEMKKRAEHKGFRITAMGAFIGQHSLNAQIATGRPDKKDEEIQISFGKAIYNKVINNNDIGLSDKVKTGWGNTLGYNALISMRHILPGEYKWTSSMKSKKITDSCVGCGACERSCPVKAIDITTKNFNYNKCIGCGACINHCPKNAIISTSKLVKQVMDNFERNNKARLEPDIFI
jgi:ferredoxin/flavodoxin